MAEPEPGKRIYPQLPSNVWWALRRKFLQSLPANLNGTYLATVLAVEKSAAQNYFNELKFIGLVDKEGKVNQPLAKKWRDDKQYAEACKEIRENVYPESLLQVCPPPNPNRDEVVRWFLHDAGLGKGAAGNKAKFYLLVCSGVIAEDQPTGRSPKSSRSQSAPVEKLTAVKPAAAQQSEPAPRRGATNESFRTDARIHIDIHVHISPQSTPDQIEAIFSAMAKHLGRSGTE